MTALGDWTFKTGVESIAGKKSDELRLICIFRSMPIMICNRLKTSNTSNRFCWSFSVLLSDFSVLPPESQNWRKRLTQYDRRHWSARNGGLAGYLHGLTSILWIPSLRRGQPTYWLLNTCDRDIAALCRSRKYDNLIIGFDRHRKGQVYRSTPCCGITKQMTKSSTRCPRVGSKWSTIGRFCPTLLRGVRREFCDCVFDAFQTDINASIPNYLPSPKGNDWDTPL